MTDRIAYSIPFVLVLLAGTDLLLNEGQILLYLSKKLLDFVTWLQFWR